MELADNSGIENNPLGDLFDGLFGKYKNLVLSGMMAMSEYWHCVVVVVVVVVALHVSAP